MVASAVHLSWNINVYDFQVEGWPRRSFWGYRMSASENLRHNFNCVSFKIAPCDTFTDQRPLKLWKLTGWIWHSDYRTTILHAFNCTHKSTAQLRREIESLTRRIDSFRIRSQGFRCSQQNTMNNWPASRSSTVRLRGWWPETSARRTGTWTDPWSNPGASQWWFLRKPKH
jgi:hypothetical protein